MSADAVVVDAALRGEPARPGRPAEGGYDILADVEAGRRIARFADRLVAA